MMTKYLMLFFGMLFGVMTFLQAFPMEGEFTCSDHQADIAVGMRAVPVRREIQEDAGRAAFTAEQQCGSAFVGGDEENDGGYSEDALLSSIPPEQAEPSIAATREMSLANIVAGANQLHPYTREIALMRLEEHWDLYGIQKFLNDTWPRDHQDVSFYMTQAQECGIDFKKMEGVVISKDALDVLQRGADFKVLHAFNTYRDHVRAASKMGRTASAVKWLSLAQQMQAAMEWNIKEKAWSTKANEATLTAKRLELTDEERSVRETAKAEVYKAAIKNIQRWEECNKKNIQLTKLQWIEEQGFDGVAAAAYARAKEEQSLLLKKREESLAFSVNAIRAVDDAVIGEQANDSDKIWNAMKEANNWKTAASLIQ